MAVPEAMGLRDPWCGLTGSADFTAWVLRELHTFSSACSACLCSHSSRKPWAPGPRLQPHLHPRSLLTQSMHFLPSLLTGLASAAPPASPEQAHTLLARR